jgi:YVTN family beta-propeller protein
MAPSRCFGNRKSSSREIETGVSRAPLTRCLGPPSSPSVMPRSLSESTVIALGYRLMVPTIWCYSFSEAGAGRRLRGRRAWVHGCTSLEKGLRAVLAGSLLFGGIAVGSVFIDSLPASAATVVQTIGVGSVPYGVSSDGTHVWVANAGGNTVTELNASTGAVVQTIGVGGNPIGVSSDGTHVWVANFDEKTVTSWTPRPGRSSRPSGWAMNPTASPPTAPTSGWRTSSTTR